MYESMMGLSMICLIIGITSGATNSNFIYISCFALVGYVIIRFIRLLVGSKNIRKKEKL